jgi:hypothetical protein
MELMYDLPLPIPYQYVVFILTNLPQVPVLFDTAPEDMIPNTPEENALGAYMRDAFATFAKNPSEGLLSFGENGQGWPKYDPEGNTLVRLGYKNRTGPNLAKGEKYDSMCITHTALHPLWRMTV